MGCRSPGESCKRSNAYNMTVTHLIAYLRDYTGLYDEARNCAYYAAKRAASLRVNKRATNHHYCMRGGVLINEIILTIAYFVQYINTALIVV